MKEVRISQRPRQARAVEDGGDYWQMSNRRKMKIANEVGLKSVFREEDAYLRWDRRQSLWSIDKGRFSVLGEIFP